MKKILLSLLVLLIFLGGCNKETTFNPQSPQKYIFDSINMSDMNNGWAINEGKGKVYKTKEGGKSWIDVSPTDQSLINSYISSYYFMDSSTAWILYDSSILYSTEDGGKHWQDEKVPFNSANLLFTRHNDAIVGWALKSYGMASGNEPVALYKYENNSWTLITEGEMPQKENTRKYTIPWTGEKKGFVMLPDMLTGFITVEYRSPGNYGLYVTNDGGKTWYSKKLDILENKKDESFVMYSPRFFNYGKKLTVILPVLCEKINDDYSIIFFSKDAEETIWHEESNLKIKEKIIYMDITDQLHWWVLTAGGNLYKTEDSGKNWIKLSPIKNATEVQFVNPKTGFALVKSNDKTMILRSDDVGQSWKKIYF